MRIREWMTAIVIALPLISFFLWHAWLAAAAYSLIVFWIAWVRYAHPIVFIERRSGGISPRVLRWLMRNQEIRYCHAYAITIRGYGIGLGVAVPEDEDEY